MERKRRTEPQPPGTARSWEQVLTQQRDSFMLMPATAMEPRAFPRASPLMLSETLPGWHCCPTASKRELGHRPSDLLSIRVANTRGWGRARVCLPQHTEPKQARALADANSAAASAKAGLEPHNFALL